MIYSSARFLAPYLASKHSMYGLLKISQEILLGWIGWIRIVVIFEYDRIVIEDLFLFEA